MSQPPNLRRQASSQSFLVLAAQRPWDTFGVLLGGLGVCCLIALHLSSTGRLSSTWAVLLCVCAWIAITWVSIARVRKPLLNLTDIGGFRHTIAGYHPNRYSPGAFLMGLAVILTFRLLPQWDDAGHRWLLLAAGASLVSFLGAYHNTLIFTDIGLFHLAQPWWRRNKNLSGADEGLKAALICTWDEVKGFRFTFPDNRDVLQLTMRRGTFGIGKKLNLTMPLSHEEIKSLDALLREYAPEETSEPPIEHGAQLASLRH